MSSEKVKGNGVFREPHNSYKAMAKNHLNYEKKSEKSLELDISKFENDLRLSVNHPYFKLMERESAERLKRLDLLASMVELLRAEMKRERRRLRRQCR